MGEWRYSSTILDLSTYAMRTYRWVEVSLHHSWPRHQMKVSGRLHAPATLPPGKEPHGTHWIGGWVGPWTFWRREKYYPWWDSIPSLPARSPLLYRLSYRDSFWRQWRRENLLPLPRVDCSVVRPVTRSLYRLIHPNTLSSFPVFFTHVCSSCTIAVAFTSGLPNDSQYLKSCM
jgi:hypothetical protein